MKAKIYPSWLTVAHSGLVNVPIYHWILYVFISKTMINDAVITALKKAVGGFDQLGARQIWAKLRSVSLSNNTDLIVGCGIRMWIEWC